MINIRHLLREEMFSPIYSALGQNPDYVMVTTLDPYLVFERFLHLRCAARQFEVTVHYHRVEPRLHL